MYFIHIYPSSTILKSKHAIQHKTNTINRANLRYVERNMIGKKGKNKSKLFKLERARNKEKEREREIN